MMVAEIILMIKYTIKAVNNTKISTVMKLNFTRIHDIKKIPRISKIVYVKMAIILPGSEYLMITSSVSVCSLYSMHMIFSVNKNAVDERADKKYNGKE